MKIRYLKIDKNLIIRLLFIVLFLLVFLRGGIGINISTNILLCIACMIVILGDINDIIALCLSCIPLYTTINYVYPILIGSAVLVIKKYKSFIIDRVFIITIAIFLWELLHGFIGDFSSKVLLANMAPYIFLFSIYSCRSNKLNYRYISHIFSCFVILTGCNFVFRMVSIQGGNLLYTVQNMGRLGMLAEDYGSLTGQINPNSLGIMCVLAITTLMQNYFFEKKEKCCFLYVIILMILGALTLSKTYLVLLALVCFLLIIGQKGGIGRKIKFIGVLTIIVAIGVFVIATIFPNTLERFGMRWIEDDLSSGRISIMAEASSAILSNPKILFFGTGLQNYSEKVLYYVSTPPHDAVHEILMLWGIPGILLICSYFCIIILSAQARNKNMNIINFIPLIIIIAKGLAGHLITSGYTMLALSLAYLSLAHNFNTNKSNSDISHISD